MIACRGPLITGKKLNVLLLHRTGVTAERVTDKHGRLNVILIG